MEDFNASMAPAGQQNFLERKENFEENLIMNEEFLYVIINCITIFVDMFIIFIILRFKALQTKTRLFILNWIITDFLFLTFNSSMYRLYSKLHSNMEIYEFYCLFSQLEFLMLSLKASYVLMLHSNFAYDRLNLTSFKYTVMFTWGIIILLGAISASYCYKQIYNGFPILLYLLVFAILFGTCVFSSISVYNTKRRFKDFKITLRFALTLTYVFCWFLSWFCLVVDVSLEISEYSAGFLIGVGIGNSLGYGNGIFTLLILLYMDSDFKTGVFNAFSCSNFELPLRHAPADDTVSIYLNNESQ